MRALFGAVTVTTEVSSRSVPYYSGTKLAVQLPRGGGDVFGTDFSKEKLASIFVLQMAANAVIAIPAPRKMLEIYGGNAPKEGSTADVFMHLIASSLTGIAIMAYLLRYASTEKRMIAFWGTTPYIYQNWKLLLNGTFKLTGFQEDFGVAMLLSFAPALLLWTGMGDTDLIIKYFASTPGLLGTLSLIKYFALTPGLLGTSSFLGSDGLAKTMYGVPIADGTMIATAKKLLKR